MGIKRNADRTATVTREPAGKAIGVKNPFLNSVPVPKSARSTVGKTTTKPVPRRRK